jgi:hypothetical protein
MGQTGGQKDAGKIAAQQAQEETALYNMAEPSILASLSGFVQDLGAPGSEPASITSAFKEIRSDTNKAYAGAAKSSTATVEQIAKQGGSRMDPGATKSASDEILFSLEKNRRGTMRGLAQQETDAAMSQRDFDLSSILGVGEGGVGGAFGFQNDALNAARLNTSNPTGGAISGAASGAALGAPYAGATYGLSVLAGALIGGGIGYYAGGG